MISSWYMGIYKMNKFNAMSKVLSSEIMKRDPYNNEWKFVFKGFVFAVISKNAGKYFPHYSGRKGSLKVCNSFMQAVAEILEYFIEIHNANMVAGGEMVFSTDKVQAFIGSDCELYIKPVQGELLQVTSRTTLEHLQKYCKELGGTDTLKDLAERINSNYNDYAMNLT